MEKSPLQLSSIYAENFRNLVFHQPLKLNNLNILVGSNGSGKSNFLNLVFFYHEALMSNGGEFDKFTRAIAHYGGASMVNKRSPEEKVKMSFGWTDNEVLNDELVYELVLSFNKQTPQIVHEKLFNQKNKTSTKLKDSNYPSEIGGFRVPSKHDNIPDIVSLSSTPKDLIQDDIYFSLKRFAESIIRWQKYNASGMSMREVSRSEPKLGLTDKYLSSDGKNLPLVIHNLFAESLDFDDELNEAMKDILPQTRRIKPNSVRHNITLEWHYKDFKDPFFLDEMSDGTVRMLCWATILLSPDPPKLIILDEPELGLHPAWMKPLGRWIKRAAQKTQVILSTHSPDLLDEFTDQWQNVIRFDQEPNGTDYTPVSLAEKKSLKELIEKEGYQLGDLYRAGDPSLGGWPW